MTCQDSVFYGKGLSKSLICATPQYTLIFFLLAVSSLLNECCLKHGYPYTPHLVIIDACSIIERRKRKHCSFVQCTTQRLSCPSHLHVTKNIDMFAFAEHSSQNEMRRNDSAFHVQSLCKPFFTIHKLQVSML